MHLEAISPSSHAHNVLPGFFPQGIRVDQPPRHQEIAWRHQFVSPHKTPLPNDEMPLPCIGGVGMKRAPTVIFHQNIVDVHTKRTEIREMISRFVLPDGTLAMPCDVHPEIEEAGLESYYDSKTVLSVFRNIAINKGTHTDTQKHSINFYPKTILSGKALRSLYEFSGLFGVDTKKIVVEVLGKSKEAIPTSELEVALRKIQEKLGCLIAFDDCPLRWNNIPRMRQFSLPIDFIKINGGHVKKHFDRNRDNPEAFQTAIRELIANVSSDHPNAKVVVKGVGNKEIETLLEEMTEVDYLQGHHIHMPSLMEERIWNA